MIAAAISVPLNAWCLASPPPGRLPGTSFAASRFDDAGRSAVLSVAGRVELMCCCCSARKAGLGPWLRAHDIKIIFAVPGIVRRPCLSPFLHRTGGWLLMQAQNGDEQAATIVLTPWLANVLARHAALTSSGA
jgi:sulfate transport system permease protein